MIGAQTNVSQVTSFGSSDRLTATQAGLRQQLCEQRGRLLGIAWSWCHDRAQAEDLVQETLARALAALGRLRDASRLEVWVTRVMVNLYRDQYRRVVPLTGIEIDIAADAGDPVDAAERRESQRRVRDAMSSLGETQRHVLALVDIAEFSYVETAQILDVPVGTVMSRLWRARRQLRELIERQAPADAAQPRLAAGVA